MIDKNSQFYFLLVVLVGTLALTFFIFQPFLYALILALVFTVIIQPIHQRISVFTGKYEGFAVFLTMLSIVVFIAFPVGVLFTKITQEAGQLYASLSDGNAGILAALNTLIRDMQEFFPGMSQIAPVDVHQYTKQGLEWLLRNTGSLFANIAQMLMSFFVFLISFYYLLKDGDKLKKFVVNLSPFADSDDEIILKKLAQSANSVVKGSLVVALAQGALSAVGFAIFGVPNPVLWGSVASVAALVPGVGTMLVLVPAALFLFFTGENVAGFGLIAWGVGAVGLVDNILGPKLMARGAKLHPLLVLLSVLGGLVFFGPIGILLGPLTVSLLIALLDLHLKK